MANGARPERSRVGGLHAHAGLRPGLLSDELCVALGPDSSRTGLPIPLDDLGGIHGNQVLHAKSDTNISQRPEGRSWATHLRREGRALAHSVLDSSRNRPQISN